MKVVIQRVSSAKLSVEGELISEIGRGLVVYFGVSLGDYAESAAILAAKISKLRIFEDGAGKMNLSISDEGGEILSVSQFTLLADTSRGNRPSFTGAEKPDRAKQIYEFFCEELERLGVKVKRGIFGADMKIEQVNEGPVTIILEA